MRRPAALAICRRELQHYFNSIIGYVYLFVFLALTGFIFMSQFFITSLADMRVFFHFLPLVLAVFIPAISMRQWAEEKRGNTFELLLTLPVRARDLVLGKFLAGFTFYLVALAGTGVIPLMLVILGDPDPGPMVGGYVGAGLLGGFLLALGLLISGFSRDQIVAFVVTALAAFSLVLVGTEFIAATLDGWVPGLGNFLRDISVITHLSGFQKGVLDLGDALYFVLGAAVFLVLNGFWIDGRMRQGQTRNFTFVATGAVTAFVLTSVFFLGPMGGRWDVTEAGLYTLSRHSRDMLRSLETPVTVNYYVSPASKMPTRFRKLERRVTDKLDEFRVASEGRLDFKVIHRDTSRLAEEEPADPQASTAESGIQPFQVQSVEADEVGVRLVYSAMAIHRAEETPEVIPHVLPENVDALEYLLVSKIYRMGLARKPKVAIVAPYKEIRVDPAMLKLMAQVGESLPVAQKTDDYSLLSFALEEEGYETSRVDLTEESPIPEGTDTLLVLDPAEFTIAQLRAVDRFLGSGGSVFLAVQSFEYGYAPSPSGVLEVTPERKNHKINMLLEPWGLGVDERFLIDENSEALNITSGTSLGILEISVPLRLPLHIRVDSFGMNSEVSLTDRLSPLLYLWGSALVRDEATLGDWGLESTLLLRSSADSWLIPVKAGSLGARDLEPAEDSPEGPFALAVLVEGSFPPVFRTEAEAGDTPSRSEGVSPSGKLILIGAVTPFRNELIRQGGHWTFVMNAVDRLSLDADLSQIRSKQPTSRSIGPVSPPAKVVWRLAGSFSIPVMMALFGWFHILMRHREKKRYLAWIRAGV